MYQKPIEKMICDSDHGDGGIYFYEDHFDWVNRNSGRGFRIFYDTIKDVQVTMSHKKRITITTKGGKVEHLYLYKYETLLDLLTDLMNKSKNKEQEKVEVVEEDALTKLERLAKLHDSGAITDEEFAEAKAKLLK